MSQSYDRDNDDYEDAYEPSYEESKARNAELQAEAKANYAEDNTDRWDADEERRHAENVRDAVVQEREDREEYTQAYRDDDGDEGHEDRIQQLRDQEQLANNHMAHLDGDYKYVGSMREASPDVQDDGEQDMDLEDSDGN